MRIKLVDVDGHAKKKMFGATVYPNIALCKIARYHRQLGNSVEWAVAYEHYDRVYMSRIFNFSPDDLTVYDADQVIRGGTGYDISSRLPDEIDRLQPDYSIYPHVPADTAYGFLTRGCPNRCRWCVVPRKEGAIVPYMDIDEIAIEGRKKVILMDNNILAAGDYAMQQLEKIIWKNYRVDFNQALDARLVTDDFARLLARVHWLEHNRIRFGCDTHAQIAECERAMEMISGYGFKGEYFIYTMLNDNFQECYDRINHWWMKMRSARINQAGNWCYAYAQPYRDPDNPNRLIPQWQKDMARWVNKRSTFVVASFAEFVPRKGFRCQEYIDMAAAGKPIP